MFRLLSVMWKRWTFSRHGCHVPPAAVSADPGAVARSRTPQRAPGLRGAPGGSACPSGGTRRQHKRPAIAAGRVSYVSFPTSSTDAFLQDFKLTMPSRFDFFFFFKYHLWEAFKEIPNQHR